MKLPWSKPKKATPPNGDLAREQERAEQAKKNATAALSRAKRLAAEVKPVAEKLRKEQRLNHFTATFEKAFGGE